MAANYEPVITVDQETNQVTFSVAGTAVVPVWVFQDKDGEWTDYNTGNGYKRIFAASGEHGVRMYVSNAAGVSPDYVGKTFVLNNSLISFDKYIRQISGGAEKIWRIDNTAPGHLACGESVASPANWWAASADEKAGTGLYDNRLTFTSEGGYIFDPGEAGTVYVNIGVTASQYTSKKGDAEADYSVPVEKQTATYAFSVEGDDVYLTLPAGTLFPYIPNDAFISDTRFRLVNLDNNAMTLVSWDGGIAWQYILTSKEAAQVFNGFKYNADSNLWLPADSAHEIFQYYATGAGWEGLANPDYTDEGGVYSFVLETETVAQWQAQFHITPTAPIAVSSATRYDYSVIVSSSVDLPSVTFKLTDINSDDNFLFANTIAIPANQDYIYYLTDLEGIDADGVKMVFDFGGNPAGADITISHIVLKDHAVDDGTVLPGGGDQEPEVGAHYDITGATNLWRSATVNYGFWYADGNWSQIANPEYEVLEHNGLRVTIPDGIGGSEWMGQTQWHTSIPASADKKYDFCFTVESDEEVTLTVKLAWEGNDNDHFFFYDNNFKVPAGVKTVYKQPNIAPDTDYDAIVLFIDCGRCPVGDVLTFTDFCFQEHQEPIGGGDTGATFDYNSDKNLWKAADANHTYSQYYAPGWAQIANPEITNNGSEYSFYCPEATSDQWQNQFFIIPAADIVLNPDKTYDFQCKVTLSQDVPQVTFKLTGVADDANFVFTERRDITAYDEFVFELTDVNQEFKTAEAVKMVFDFGGNPADLEVVIKDIILYEHEGGSSSGGDDNPGEPVDTREPGSEEAWYNVNGDTNLWKAQTPTPEFWFADAGWSRISDPAYEALPGGGITLTVPEGVGGSVWQGQVKLHTAIPAEHASEYDFYAEITMSTGAPVTVKLTGEEDDADHDMFYVESFETAEGLNKFGMPYVFPKADISNLLLIFDFGRVPAGTEITVDKICFQKHIPASEAPEDEGGENLWPGADVTLSTWFSGTDWLGGLEPQTIFPLEGNGLVVVVPEGIGGSEWMGQVKLQSDIPVSAASQYSFQCKIASTADGVATVKLTCTEDDDAHAFFYDNGVALSKASPVVVKKKPVTYEDADPSKALLIFDFGRMPAGAAITISDIALREL